MAAKLNKVVTWGMRAAALSAALAVAACDSPEERAEEHFERGMDLLESSGPTQAALEFRNAVRMSEGHPGAHFQLGLIAREKGDVREAAREFSAVVERDPGNAEAQRYLGQALMVLGDLQRALTAFNAALEKDPNDVLSLVGSGAVALRMNDVETAVARANKALEIDPDSIDAAVVLATERFNAEARDEAYAIIDERLAREPDNKSLHVTKLALLNRAGDTPGTERQLSKMIELFPEETTLMAQRARLRAQTGDMEGAEKDLRVLVEAAEAPPQTVLALIEVLRRTQGEEAAREELSRRVDSAATRENADILRMALSTFDLRNSDDAAAKQTLETLISQDTEATLRNRARAMLGGLMLKAGDKQGALDQAAAVLSEDAGNVGALALRAEVAIQDNRAEEAISDLRLASASSPDDPRLMLLEASAHERNGDLSLSADRMAAATRASNYAPEYALRYATLLRGQGDLAGAEEALNESAQRNDRSIEVWRALAEIRLRQGKSEGAERAGEKLRALNDEEGAGRISAAILAARGESDRSIAELEKLAMDADEQAASSALTALVVAYARSGDIDRAVSRVEEEMAARPDDPLPMLLRAELHAFSGDQRAAEEKVRDAIAADPKRPIGYLAMSRLDMRRNDVDAAKATLNEGIAQTDAPSLRFTLAQIEERQGNYGQAIDLYRRLSDENPDSIVYANNLASLVTDHQEIGPDELDLLGRLATRLRGYNTPEFQDTYAWVRFLQGQVDEARLAIDKALAGGSSNPVIHYHAGRIYAAAGDTETARAHLQAALAAGEAVPLAEEARGALATLDEQTPAPSAGGGQPESVN